MLVTDPSGLVTVIVAVVDGGCAGTWTQIRSSPIKQLFGIATSSSGAGSPLIVTLTPAQRKLAPNNVVC